MNLIAYDLGTGGVKASLYNEAFETLAKSFLEYPTFYPGRNLHVQRIADWWRGVALSTRRLLAESGVAPGTIGCVALSGHSLVAVPLDAQLQALEDEVPIWSDTRAEAEAEEFFRRIDRDYWYMTTGNGFPPACYSVFKLMWLRRNRPELFEKTFKVAGSKDYINLLLTGQLYTDPSYASGLGVFSLEKNALSPDLLAASGLPLRLFPEIVPPHTVIGRVTKEAAEATGLSEGTCVACGGVDNACMALGAVGAESGRIYTSLGSSSWVPVNSEKPVLDVKRRPYVFSHIQERMYTSAFSIFAGGASFRWAKEALCRDILTEQDVYDRMCQMAQSSPLGANGIFFNPSLAGGTSQDKSVNIRGAFVGLHLGTTREDMVRAAMEGIALNLKNAISFLKLHAPVSDEILFCGGGSRSAFWMQMFADVFGMKILKTNVDQDAASLGAAAIAARAIGLWKDYAAIPSLHHLERVSLPDPQNHEEYAALQVRFNHVSEVLADLGDYLAGRVSLRA